MIIESVNIAFKMIVGFDFKLIEILLLSIKINLISLFFSCLIGLPLGTILALNKFRFKSLILGILNSLMGIPPVVVGLIVYLNFSRSGPLGWLGLLYTPTAMIIAQIIIITPIILCLSCQIIEDLKVEYDDFFQSLVISNFSAVFSYLYEARYSLFSVILAGFGRAISEVGAVIIVGGNIDHLTRVMTTAIAMETAKGELSLALALGLILLVVSLSINIFVMYIKSYAKKKSYE